jgi:hypothetical protein
LNETQEGILPGTHYTGKSGQFATMAVLASRGYNVSIPEIDVGDDVFVLNDKTGQLNRIQVKTGSGIPLKRHKGAFRCQFSVKISHVKDQTVLGSHYVFVGMYNLKWRYVVMDRAVLRDLIERGWGTQNGDSQRILSIVYFKDGSAKSSTRENGIDLSTYVNNWNPWPVI